MSSTITVVLTETEDSYEINPQQYNVRTYGELKRVIQSLNSSIDPSIYQFTYTEDDSPNPLEDNQPINPEIESVNLSPNLLDLRVQDRNPNTLNQFVAFPSETEVVSLPCTQTINQIKQHYAREMGDSLEMLTFNGKVLSDNERLLDCGLKPAPAINILTGRFSVMFRDIHTDREVRLDNLTDNLSVAQMKQRYATKERRVNIDRAELSIRRPEEDTEIQLDDTKTLYESGVTNDTLIEMKTPAYTVQLVENAPAMSSQSGSQSINADVTVFDHYTPLQIKEEYNKTASVPLMTGDSLVHNGDVIGENTQLSKLKVVDRATIHITRENLTVQRFDYICADCGNDNKLKKTDAVRCHECGHRVLYKKRTTRPCQYLAR